MQIDLTGQTAIVTGAARGIGAALARGLAATGAAVVLAARSADLLDALAAEIVARGGRSLAVPTDMGKRGDIDRLVAAAMDAFGRLDIVVSNAAATSAIAPVLELEMDRWREIQRVNVEGTLGLLQACGSHLVRQRSGKVLIVSSTLGLNGNPNSSAYGASKAALNHLTRTVAAEWGPAGVRVNGLLPGPVATERVSAVTQDAELSAAIEALMPLGGWPQPDDMVGPALFLLSDLSRCVTGHLLIVDNGLGAIAREAGFARPKRVAA